ncbi:MAG: HIT domain-containing protein [Pedosphaera sp.]|nr:HIT domain-containing protein [Pedosphaera sp.]MSU42499.1 HIT domain-containing protein [Pedosphaera sp.]
MEALHAPWRIQYILGPKRTPDGGSIFSEVAQSSDDEANHVLVRARSCFAVLNTFPYNAGHILVVPYRTIATLEELTDDEMLELFKLVRRCVQALKQTLHPDGCNVGLNLGRAAGAGIEEHLHIHIVPRWQGDTNFMPILAQTSVIPEALTETAAKLRAALATLSTQS